MAENAENTKPKEVKGLSFVEQMIADDLKEGKNGGRIQTRFPLSAGAQRLPSHRPRQGYMHGLRCC